MLVTVEFTLQCMEQPVIIIVDTLFIALVFDNVMCVLYIFSDVDAIRNIMLFSGSCTTEISGSITSSGMPVCLTCTVTFFYNSLSLHLLFHMQSVAMITGITVGILVWTALLVITTGVITFFCTRRCYNKKTTPPPNEKSVYYETVHSDSVQMQPSPAYISLEEAK